MKNCEIKINVDSMSATKLLFLISILSVFAAPIFVSGALKVNGENAVASAIDKAEAAMASAYEAVLDAEQAGANVSGLLAQLNVAGEYLANAHIRYELGNYDNATIFANNCYNIGMEVRNEAVEKKNEAYSLWITNLVVRMTISIVGAISVGFLSFLVWRVFKRRYQKRILGMKPEVVSGES